MSDYETPKPDDLTDEQLWTYTAVYRAVRDAMQDIERERDEAYIDYMRNRSFAAGP